MPKNYKEDFRNYDKEAQELIKGLSKDKLYELYEVVITQQQRSQSEERGKELTAVREVIEGTRGLDVYRMRKIRDGYKSEMAQSARAKDGNTKPNKRRV